MNQIDEWMVKLNPPRRNHFFTGKMMGVAQFEREQRYGMSQRWLINRLTVGTGVLCGLEVSVNATGNLLRVARGVALDPLGREIVVAHDASLDPFATSAPGCGGGTAITEPGEYLLCLSYRECLAEALPVQFSEDCSGQLECEPDAAVETYSLGLQPFVARPGAFDCATWTRPVPATPESATAAPGIAELRARLAEQFGTACAPPASADCVPLAKVTVISSDAGVLSISSPVSLQPRNPIYSQAQLLELILCLAKCCGEGHETPPVSTDTLRVERVEVVGLSVATESAPHPPEFVALTPVTGVSPTSFAAGATLASVPLALRVTFNAPIDASSIPDPLAGSLGTPTISLTRDGAVLPAPFALLEQPNVALVFVRGGQQPSGIIGHAGAFPSQVGSLLGPLLPGSYRLTLAGGADESTPAIRSWPSATSQRLDGEWIDPTHFPSGTQRSGDGVPGGEFAVDFVIVETLRLTAIDAGQGDAGAGPYAVVWNEGGVTLGFVFNAPMDPTTLQTGVRAQLDDGTVITPNAVVPSGSNKWLVTFPGADTEFYFPSPHGAPYTARITLDGSTLSSASQAPFDGETPSGTTLPSGNGLPGGDYTFTLTINP